MAKQATKPKADRGVYRKFEVWRTDGSHKPGQKHDGCSYFVLDLDHDPHALAALRAYADSCREDFPELAKDLDWSTSMGPGRISGLFRARMDEEDE